MTRDGQLMWPRNYLHQSLTPDHWCDTSPLGRLSKRYLASAVA